MAAAGQLNVIDSPSRGSRSVDCFEKLEQIGEGTYGYVLFLTFFFNTSQFYFILKIPLFIMLAVKFIWPKRSKPAKLLLSRKYVWTMKEKGYKCYVLFLYVLLISFSFESYCKLCLSLQFPITAIREIKILKKLHHENVIKLKEIVTSPGPEKDDQGRPGKFILFH